MVRSASVSIRVDGALIGSCGFNSVVVERGVGVMAQGGSAIFDDFRIAINDPAFGGAALHAATAVTAEAHVVQVDEDDAVALLDAAAQAWVDAGLVEADDAEALLGGVVIEVVDLGGTQIAEIDGGVIRIDLDAATAGSSIPRRRSTRSSEPTGSPTRGAPPTAASIS